MIGAPDEDEGGTRRFFILCAVFVLVVSMPAVIQLVRTGGYLYFRNGPDEGYYLQYDVSLRTQGMSRPGQYLVTALHHVGLSGGALNALLDVTLPLAVLLMARAIGRGLGLTGRAASACAFIVVLGPLVFTATNPLVGALYRFCVEHGLIAYLAVPDGIFLPILRTPEPQFSYVLLGAGILAGLRVHSFIPVYAVLPFLYPFVAIPAAFVTVGLTIRAFPGASRLHPLVSMFAAYAIVSIGAAVMLRLFVDRAMQGALVASHLPLASLTSLAALIGWLGLRRRLDPEWRARALLGAFAPLAAANIHVITGWVMVPVEVEMYAGGACAALLCGGALVAHAADAAVTVRQVRARQWLAAAAVIILAARAIAANVAEVFAAPLMERPVLEALRADAGRVVWNDGRRSRLLALIFPGQKPTALDFGQVWPQSDPDAHLERYLAVRRAILDDHRAPGFAVVLAALDAGYAHSNEEALFLMTGRKNKTYRVNRNVRLEAERRTARATDLMYIVERTPGRLEIDR